MTRSTRSQRWWARCSAPPAGVDCRSRPATSESARHEPFECQRKLAEVGQFGRPGYVALFAETVDPYRSESELISSGEIVECTCGDVNVVSAVCAGALEKLLPVAGRGLVRTCLSRGNPGVHGHADLQQRGSQQIWVGVRQDGQPPSVLPQR